jgi:hypothetical protein
VAFAIAVAVTVAYSPSPKRHLTKGAKPPQWRDPCICFLLLIPILSVAKGESEDPKNKSKKTA